MNQYEYITQLKKYLKKMPQTEREEVIEYYKEYFLEAGPEEEQIIIKNLGSPKKLANQLLAQSYMKEVNQMDTSAKKGFSSIWIIFLAILASPIALPLGLVVIVVIVALLICVSAVIISLFVSAAAIFLSGILCAGISFFVLPTSFATFIFSLGAGFVLIGLGAVFLLGLWKACKALIKGIANLAQRIVSKENIDEKTN